MTAYADNVGRYWKFLFQERKAWPALIYVEINPEELHPLEASATKLDCKTPANASY